MTIDELHGLRVLLVEDEYLIADDARRALEFAGVIVLGPAPSVAEARDLLEREDLVDGAVLDVNLGGEKVFTLVEVLKRRGVPFVFATAYGARDMPPAYRDVPRLEKPITAVQVARTLDWASGGR